MRTRELCSWAILFIGLTQMAGDLFGNRVIKGIGAATAMAPCPKVFCNMGGMEPFASSFEIIADGDKTTRIPITPELYQQLRGPYNRRNVYGAAIAAAPILPERVWQTVFSYAFNPNGPLRHDLALPEKTNSIHILVRTKTRNGSQEWIFPCTK